MYRAEADKEGKPFTIKRLLETFKGTGPVFSVPDDVLEAAQQLEMDFFTTERPTPGWAIVKIGEIPGTRFLSIEAQQAFMNNNERALRESFAHAAFLPDAEVMLPSVEKLLQLRDFLPEHARLPKAVDVFFDLLIQKHLHGRQWLDTMSVATASRCQPLPEIDEPAERPVDIGLQDEGGMSFHWRRSNQFGRTRETKPGRVSGIPIGYVQVVK